jgi:hypothetical protein
MEEVDREISEMKLSLNARARIVAESYLTAVSFCILTFVVTLIFILSLIHEHPFWDRSVLRLSDEDLYVVLEESNNINGSITEPDVCYKSL